MDELRLKEVILLFLKGYNVPFSDLCTAVKHFVLEKRKGRIPQVTREQWDVLSSIADPATMH